MLFFTHFQPNAVTMTVLFSEHVISDYSPSVDGLLKVNNDHIGFYRVNHDSNMWNTISKQLQDNHLVKLSSVIYTHTEHKYTHALICSIDLKYSERKVALRKQK